MPHCLRILLKTGWSTRNKEDTMTKLGIIGAMTVEVEALKEKMTDM